MGNRQRRRRRRGRGGERRGRGNEGGREIFRGMVSAVRDETVPAGWCMFEGGGISNPQKGAERANKGATERKGDTERVRAERNRETGTETEREREEEG